MATLNRVPTGTGTTTNPLLTIVGGDSFHWQAVDDAVGAPDDNTTYLQLPSSGSGPDDDMYTFTAFAITSSAVASVKVTIRAKETGGNRTAKGVLIVNGTKYRSSSIALTTSYADYTTTEWLTNPDTSLAWVEADVEGTGSNPLTEFGFLSDSPFASRTSEFTQCYVTVDYTEAGGGTTYNESQTFTSNAGHSLADILTATGTQNFNAIASISETSVLTATATQILDVMVSESESGNLTMESAFTFAAELLEAQTGGFDYALSIDMGGVVATESESLIKEINGAVTFAKSIGMTESSQLTAVAQLTEALLAQSSSGYAGGISNVSVTVPVLLAVAFDSSLISTSTWVRMAEVSDAYKAIASETGDTWLNITESTNNWKQIN